MKKSLAAIAMLLLLQSPALADQSMLCQSLNRRLIAIPEVIGSTAEVRRHAEALRNQEDEIRYLRSKMRRTGCGAGSIVSFGRSGDACTEIAQALRQAEADRDTIRSRRAASLSIVRPNGERKAILSAMQQNGCDEVVALPEMPAELQPLPQPSFPYRSGSSITDVTTSKPKETAAAPPPPPERAYDPSQNVRTVGPVFLPDDSSIDLARPATDGAQPRQ